MFAVERAFQRLGITVVPPPCMVCGEVGPLHIGCNAECDGAKSSKRSQGDFY